MDVTFQAEAGVLRQGVRFSESTGRTGSVTAMCAGRADWHGPGGTVLPSEHVGAEPSGGGVSILQILSGSGGKLPHVQFKCLQSRYMLASTWDCPSWLMRPVQAFPLS